MSKSDSKLELQDHTAIAIQAILKGIPVIGSSLEHFIFGPLAELRARRIETTLSEVAKALQDRGKHSVASEQFVTLLESVSPALSRSTNEDKRQRFRDLLTNAASLPPESPKWEETALASELLKEIESPGLAILAAIASIKNPENQLTLTSRPVSQLCEGEFDHDSPGDPQRPLLYDWVVVEFWARKLKEKRLILYKSHDARGSFGGLSLGSLGEFLIRWTLRE